MKFVEGADVRLRANRLVSLRGGRLTALDRALARFPGVRLERVFRSSTESELAASRRVARARSGRQPG